MGHPHQLIICATYYLAFPGLQEMVDLAKNFRLIISSRNSEEPIYTGTKTKLRYLCYAALMAILSI